IYGANHYYSQDDLAIPPGALRRGVNTVEVTSESSHHGIEVLWPGPGMIVWYASPGAPSQPAGLTASASDARTISLDWDDVEGDGPVTYSLHRSTSPGFVPGASNRIASGIERSEWIDRGLDESTTYHYAVVATNAYNDDSPPSAIAQAT